MRILHIYATVNNSGDQMIGYATRLMFERYVKVTGWVSENIRKVFNYDDVKKINTFDAVVVGPGGIFLYDETNSKAGTREISGYQWLISEALLSKIKVPVLVVAAGWNQFRGRAALYPTTLKGISDLISKSSYFSVRHTGDAHSLENFLHLHEGSVKVFMCPTLLLGTSHKAEVQRKRILAIQIAGDRPKLRYTVGIKRTYEILSEYISVMSKDFPEIHIVDQCCDTGFFKFIKERRKDVKFVSLVNKSLDQQLTYYKEIGVMLATRGHAQMIPIGCATPTVSLITHNKVAYFLDDLKRLAPASRISETGVDITRVRSGDLVQATRIARSLDYTLVNSAIEKSIIASFQEMLSIL